jgi:mannose-6-phosphate isomerase-like protein (cupin superfamily)
MQEEFDFPEFVRSLPPADLPFENLQGWLLQSEHGHVLFTEATDRMTVARHTHGDQWGIVVNGEIDILIGRQVLTWKRGDSYFIPAGTIHGARIYRGYRGVDYYRDGDCYHALPAPEAEDEGEWRITQD